MNKKATRKAAPEMQRTGEDPALASAVALFERGDYVAARAAFGALRASPALTEGAQREVEELYAASGLDPVVWQTVLGGLVLLGAVLAFTASIQP